MVLAVSKLRKNENFLKKVAKKFGQFKKMLYLCIVKEKQLDSKRKKNYYFFEKSCKKIW